MSRDDRDELLQLVDAAGRPAGAATRASCHADPALIHASVAVLVHDSAGRLYLQRRSWSKDTCPGMWDLSATGHVGAGEDVRAAALRELAEELGVDDAALEPVAALLVPLPRETEYATVWRCVHAGTLRPDPAEVAEGVWVDAAAAPRHRGLTSYAARILAHLRE